MSFKLTLMTCSRDFPTAFVNHAKSQSLVFRFIVPFAKATAVLVEACEAAPDILRLSKSVNTVKSRYGCEVVSTSATLC